MRIVFFNVPMSVCWKTDCLWSLAFQAESISKARVLIERGVVLDFTRQVSAEIEDLPETVGEQEEKKLALQVLWFLWQHDYRRGVKVVCGKREYRISDYPEMRSLFYPLG